MKKHSGNAQTGDCFLLRLPNELQYESRVDVLAPTLYSEVQMGAGTASCIACNANHLSGHDGSPLPNQHLGKVAIADGVIAVAEGDEPARTLVVPHLDHHARQHGVGFLAFGTQVDAVVPPALPAERVGTEAVG